MEPCHDQNEGGRVINQSFNCSLGCERIINNNLNYDCLDLSSCPRCWYMNSWQHGLLVSHVPASRATSASTQGAHHIPHQTSGRTTLCSRHVFSLLQATSPVWTFSMRTTYQNHHLLKNTGQTFPHHYPADAQASL